MPTTRLNLSNPHWLSRNLTESWLTIGPKGDPKQEMDHRTTQWPGRAKCPAAAHMAAGMQQGVHFGGWMPQIQTRLCEISYSSVHFSLAEPWNGLSALPTSPWVPFTVSVCPSPSFHLRWLWTGCMCDWCWMPAFRLLELFCPHKEQKGQLPPYTQLGSPQPVTGGQGDWNASSLPR